MRYVADDTDIRVGQGPNFGIRVCQIYYAPITRRGSVRVMISLMPVWLKPL
jgi:hypothetical protein